MDNVLAVVSSDRGNGRCGASTSPRFMKTMPSLPLLTMIPFCPRGSLVYADFQKFMKRLRRRTGAKISFYVGGEYGEELLRPHYHACLFGYDFSDKVYFKKSASGERLYTSKFLDSLWPFGFATVGSVSFQSAAYIARYCMKKVNGQLAKSHYETITDDGEIIDRLPEFNHMSLKPAIGKRWLEKFETDVYPRDYVVINGVKTKPLSITTVCLRSGILVSFLN